MAAEDQYNTQLLTVPNNGQFGAPQIDYTEGALFDYRYFDSANIEPIYEFGFGLSYTTFEYSNLVVTPASAGIYTPTTGQTDAAPTFGTVDMDVNNYIFPEDIDRVYLYIYPYINSTNLAASSAEEDYGLPASQWLPADATDTTAQPYLPAGGAPGGNPGLYETVATVQCTVQNTGSVEGQEVAQLYVGLGDGEPPKVLRGFHKQSIAPGASATFTFELTRRDVSTWDTASQNWVQVQNPQIYVGSSSRKLPLTGSLQAGSGSAPAPAPPSSSAAPAPQSPPPAASSQSAAPQTPAAPPPASSSVAALPQSSAAAASSGYGYGSQSWGAWPATHT